MKATEERIFPFCDSYYEEHKKTPTADEILANCGGGKKEVLAIRKRWEGMNYLKQNGLDVPTRWLSLLGDFFKETRMDVDAEKKNIQEEADERIRSIQVLLDDEQDHRESADEEVAELNHKLTEKQELIDGLNDSLSALQKQVDDFVALKEKLNAEISEKSLQVRLQKEQIRDLKEEHASVLSLQKENYETRLTEKNIEIEKLTEKQNEMKLENEEKVDLVSGRLMVANSEKERLKTELQVVQKDLGKESDKNETLMKQISTLEKSLATEREKAEQIPKLEETIKTLESKAENAVNAEQEMLGKKVEEMSDLLKTLAPKKPRKTRKKNE